MSIHHFRETQAAITEKQLRRRLKGASAVERALIAADLTDGSIDLGIPTLDQACALTGAWRGYTASAKAMGPLARAAVRRGAMKLAPYHLTQKKPLRARWTSASEQERVDLIREYADEVLGLLDTITAPESERQPLLPPILIAAE